MSDQSRNNTTDIARLLALASEEHNDACASVQHGADTADVPEWARIVVKLFAGYSEQAAKSATVKLDEHRAYLYVNGVQVQSWVGAKKWEDHANELAARINEASPHQVDVQWSYDVQARLIAACQDATESDEARQVMAEAACLLASITGRPAHQVATSTTTTGEQN